MNEHLIDLAEAKSNLAAAAAYLAENINHSDGYAEAMKEIVTYFTVRGEVDLAAQFADTIKDNFVRDNLLVKIAEKCAETGDDEYAFQLADAIEDYGLQSAMRGRIAVQKAIRNEFDAALKIADGLNHPDDALAAIAVRQMFAGHKEAARQTISRIEYPAAKVQARQAIAADFYEAKDNDKANELLAEAVLEAQDIELSEEKIRILLAVAAQYIEAGQFDKALEVLDKARAASEISDGIDREMFLSNTSLDFLRAGSLDLADRTLDLICDKTHIAATLTGFSAEFEQNGERDDALETLEEAYAILKSQKDREVRDSRARFNLFGVIAARFAKLGKIERGLEIALENPSAEECNNALAEIAMACAAAGNFEMARQATGSIGDAGSQAIALINASDASDKQNANNEALNFLDKALSLVKNIVRPVIRAATLNEIVKRFFKYGEVEKTRLIAVESLQSVRQINDESHRAVGLLQLAEIYQACEFELNEAEKEIIGVMLQKAVW